VNLERVAAEIAAFANTCCHRSDGFEESMEKAVLAKLRAAVEEADAVAYRRGFEEIQKHRFQSIAQARAEGVEEGRNSKCADSGHVTQEQFKLYAKLVRAEAFEEAAKIADVHYEECKSVDIAWCPKSIAEKIRAKAKELSGNSGQVEIQ
jgi:hypothetical protein